MTQLLTTFNFRITVQEEGGAPLCDAAFSQCEGLEVTIDVTTIREGGNNAGPVHLAGVTSYGTLSLKRGMTDSLHLWDWVERVAGDAERGLRATCEVEMLAPDRSGPVAVFVLTGCLPTKVKAPALDAASGIIAIEELEITYQTLHRRTAVPDA